MTHSTTMTTMTTIKQLDSLAGANTNVSPLIQPKNSPPVLNGCDPTYKLGALLKDTGYEKIGDTLEAGKDITGLFNFRQSSSVQKILATINNSAGTNLTLKYNNAGTWTNINLSNAWDTYEDSKVSMAQFIGYCFFTGYDSTDSVFLPVGSLVGTTFSTSTNVTSMPQGKYIVRYRDRLYVLNAYYSATAYPYRAYYSSVPSAGAITWTPASDFLDVGDYGDEITGGIEAWDKLLLFTEYTCTHYNQEQKKQMWEVGCANHFTIKKSDSFVIWVDSTNVWLSAGGQPVAIGGQIIDFIRQGSPKNFFAEIVDRKYRLYVGTVTVQGVTYSNCMLTYDIATQMWFWRELADDMTAFARYNSSGTQRLYMGADTGMVYNKGKHSDSTLINSDNGTSIKSNFELAPITLDALQVEKEIATLTAYAERAGGLKLKARVIDRNTRALTPFLKLGELTKFINDFDIEIEKGAILQVAGSESGSNPYWSFYGIELGINKFADNIKT